MKMEKRSRSLLNKSGIPVQALLALLFCMTLSAVFAAAQSVPYHLLSSRRSAESESVIESDYNISVDRNLDVSEVKDAICQVIRTEKPKSYDVLTIGIYHLLDRYISESERDSKDSAVHREHRIAQYHWSKDSPKDQRRLVVNKDAKGQSLAEWRFYNFNHSKSCS